jgi:aspartyl-tRNA(Asn)/glutamyl-tRNA(Gln) amidotransferase subunit A
MEEVPVILSPVCGTVAFPHRARRFVLATTDKTFGVFQAMMPSVIWNALGFPALTIPMAISQQGLPIGVQLIGRPWEEQTLLALGERLEQLRGPLPTPPNV